MTEQPEERMTRDEIKEFIFDDLMEFLEATGETNAVTPEEIATLIDEEPSRVKGTMMQLVSEDVLEKFKDDGELYFRFAEDTLEALLEEMYESGWIPPEDDDE